MTKLVSVPEILQRVPFGKTTLYRLWADSDSNFPRPRRIGARRVGVFEDELDEWIENRPLARAAGSAG